MELTQMATQGLWNKDSLLLQIPHVDRALAENLKEKGFEQVFDIVEKVQVSSQ